MAKYADKTKTVEANLITDVQVVLDDGAVKSSPFIASSYKGRMYVAPQTGNALIMDKGDFDAQYTPVA